MDNITFKTREELVCVEPYGTGIIRVRSTKNSRLSDEKWTVEEPKTTVYKINGNSLTTGTLNVRIERTYNGCVLIFSKDNKEILRTSEDGDPAIRYIHAGGDNYRIKVIFKSNPDEHFYGLGQEQQDFLDRKGCAYSLMNYNTKSTVPFVYSSLGYGFLWNSPSPGRCEFANNRTVWESESSYQADYFVIAGETPAEIMKKYADLTGYSPEMPEWAAGFWQSKLRYESQEDLLKVAREYKKRNTAIDAIVIDYFHWTEQGEWQFDPVLWDSPENMCHELDELGIRPVVSIWPTINPASKYYKEMNENQFLVRTENGQYGLFDFYGLQTYVDVTNPDARLYFWEKVKNNYYSKGIKTFWLDQAEPEIHPQHFSNIKMYSGNGLKTAMLYPYYYAKTFYDGLKNAGENEIALLIRAAYTGIQKFGVIVWNGDIPSTFEALRQSIVSGLSMAMCGIPWWNSDIGGFHQGDTESEYFRELIVRWFQFGVFSPVMRLHGARKKPSNYKPRHPEVKEISGGDNEIWSFGESNYPILKNLIELREKLKPYILKCALNSSRTGEPIMRPMFFDFYNDKECYKLSDQYMFGKDILFAPILNRGETERYVYLPDGKWRRTTNGEIYNGGKRILCSAEINEFIAFVRDGAEVWDVFN